MGINKWGQKTGGWSPFATSPNTNTCKTICPTCDGARTYEAYDRVRRQWFTYNCNQC